MKCIWIGFAFTFSFLASAQAGRTVTIPVGKNQSVQLTNPSAGAVSYDIACYSTTGSQVVNESGKSLAANGTQFYGLHGTCASGLAPYDASGGAEILGPFRCTPSSGTVTYSAAASVCASPFYSVCTIPQSVSKVFPIAGSSFWIDPGGTSWGYQTVYSSSITTPVTGTSTLAPIIASSGTWMDQCILGSSTLYQCSVLPPSFAADGAYCCANQSTASIAFCKVTITSSASTLYLTSPQFKGGAAF